MLTGVPDYPWYAGCFGTAGGNLAGFWDRHGFPALYTGPTGGGLAPLNSGGANAGIRSMWASRAGFDGRPQNRPGHIDDYWLFYDDDFSYSYESAAVDPYRTAGRAEHLPDCIGDFMGASQNKWSDLNGECDGNIDAFAFAFWDLTGAKRTNFVALATNGEVIRDIPSGLRDWTRFRGYEAEVASQLTDFNPQVKPGNGFSFKDLRAEIDSGYPVLIVLQRFGEFARTLPGMARANPSVHAMVAFGYYDDEEGTQLVRYKSSWGGSGDNTLRRWGADAWESGLPVRGMITFRPLPKITQIRKAGRNSLTIKWEGPATEMLDMELGEARPLHRYVVERSSTIDGTNFLAVSASTPNRETTVTNLTGVSGFLRVRLVLPAAEFN